MSLTEETGSSTADTHGETEQGGSLSIDSLTGSGEMDGVTDIFVKTEQVVSPYLQSLTGTGKTECSLTAFSAVTDKAERIKAASSASSEQNKSS